MSEDTTTTEEAAIAEGVQETQPEVGQADAADVSDTTDQSTETNSDDGEAEASQPDTEVIEWAKNKGIDLSESPSDRELKLVNMARNAEKAMHEKGKQASELQKTLTEEVNNLVDPNADQMSKIQTSQAMLELQLSLRNYYDENPEARQYDGAMAELVAEDPRKAIGLIQAGGIEALHAYALRDSLKNGGTEQLKSEGAREALQQLAQKQKATAPRGNAVNSVAPTSKITRDVIAQKTREKDFNWMRQNEAEINRLVANGQL